MQVAFYARVSTSHQQHEGTIESQRRLLKQHIQHQGWSLLPEHEYIDDGISGARLDRPALDRLRDAARRGELDAVVILSPDRLARNYAHQWLLIEEFEKVNTPLIFLQNPFGDSPQGKLLTQMQGMIAEYERAQIAERTRRGRLEKARHGEFIPWAYSCYGYRYLPKRHGCRTRYLSRVGGRTTELSSDHQTAECRSNTDANGPEPRLAPGDGQKHPDQSCLCWTGAIQLSAASHPAVSQAAGTPTAFSQDWAKLSLGERMGVERRSGPQHCRAV
jgi:DNA invertase Pin-like site-specific DNA recombinase